MLQAEFSSLVKKYIQENYPAFLENFSLKEDGSLDCSIKSKSGKLSIWISTYGREITIGFQDDENKTDWHTHMSLFGANEPHEELEAMTELLGSIFSDQLPIVLSSESGFSLSSNPYGELENLSEQEIITIFKWSEL